MRKRSVLSFSGRQWREIGKASFDTEENGLDVVYLFGSHRDGPARSMTPISLYMHAHCSTVSSRSAQPP